MIAFLPVTFFSSKWTSATNGILYKWNFTFSSNESDLIFCLRESPMQGRASIINVYLYNSSITIFWFCFTSYTLPTGGQLLFLALWITLVTEKRAVIRIVKLMKPTFWCRLRRRQYICAIVFDLLCCNSSYPRCSGTYSYLEHAGAEAAAAEQKPRVGVQERRRT